MITQQDVDKFLRQIADQMVRYVRVKYDAPNFNPVIQVTFALNRKTSRGGVRNGRSFINIVAKRFLSAAQGTGMMDEPEYKSFNLDSIIGGLYNITWKKALASLVAHELGHAVQYDKGTKVGAKRVLGVEELDDRNEILRGHDWFWKRIYGDLRIQFVNNNQFEIERSPAPKPAAPAPEVVKQEVTAPATPRTGTLYVKYAYKGNSTVTRFYIDQKLKAVIVEVNRQFFKADEFGDVQEKLPFTTLAEARRFLINM
jgi:hypothetical protein